MKWNGGVAFAGGPVLRSCVEAWSKVAIQGDLPFGEGESMPTPPCIRVMAEE
jgi:hypothetical protein